MAAGRGVRLGGHKFGRYFGCLLTPGDRPSGNTLKANLHGVRLLLRRPRFPDTSRRKRDGKGEGKE